jgi:fructose-1,6-bisphosphatase/inositol monophosphatase family enzyme
MSEARSWMDAAEAVARVAGEVALRYYHRGVTVETKGDGTPVSVADRQAEEAARAWLEKHCPEDGILGEELGTTRAEARRRWILDPIDGTKTFVRRVPLWGTLVALAEGRTSSRARRISRRWMRWWSRRRGRAVCGTGGRPGSPAFRGCPRRWC